MKVLFVSPSYYPALKYGGPIQAGFLLNKALVKKNIHVDVFTTNAGLETNGIITGKWYDYNGVRVKYLNYYGYEHYNFSPSFYSELKNNVRNYDIVHITAVWNFPVMAASRLCHNNNIPYIITPNGALLREAFILKSKGIKKIYYNLFTKKNLMNSSAIHFTTLYEEKDFEEFISPVKNSFVIPNGLDLPVIQFDKESFYNKFPTLKNRKYILFLGRLHKIKGLDILIKAFKKVSGEFNDLLLVIAGPDNNNYKEEIIKTIDNDIYNKIIFTGNIDGKEKWSAYACAGLFVMPSYSENFGMSAIEAMACGTPVIISDKVGIFKEAEESKAALVVQTNAESLYAGINKILSKDELKKELSGNGKKLVNEKYDINKIAGQMIKEYKNIIAGNYN